MKGSIVFKSLVAATAVALLSGGASAMPGRGGGGHMGSASHFSGGRRGIAPRFSNRHGFGRFDRDDRFRRFDRDDRFARFDRDDRFRRFDRDDRFRRFDRDDRFFFRRNFVGFGSAAVGFPGWWGYPYYYGYYPYGYSYYGCPY
jgi:hypothetical protein